MNTKWRDGADRTLAADLPGAVGRRVVLMGRVAAVRTHGLLTFIDLLDRSGKAQLIVEGSCGPCKPGTPHDRSSAATDDAFDPPPLQAVIRAAGTVRVDPKAPNGVETALDGLDLLSEPIVPLPFNPAAIVAPIHARGPNLETALDHRTLTLRAESPLAVLRVVSAILGAFDGFARARGFTEVKSPKLVAGGTEGGAGLFEVRYFERAACLAQSPQLYKQALASTPLERVFEVGPVFRGEKHETARHLNEFTGLDMEVAFVESLDELMDIEEDLVRHLIDRVARDAAPELALLDVALPVLGESIPRLSLADAKEVATGVRPSRSKPAEDLTPEDERALCDWARREHAADAVFVHSYPAAGRPFYTRPHPDNRRLTSSFDLILRGLEVSSGSLRIHEPELLERNLRKLGLDPAGFVGYLDLFRTGCPPHGGFGLGLERLAQKFLDLPNVRYAATYPRDRHRLEP